MGNTQNNNGFVKKLFGKSSTEISVALLIMGMMAAFSIATPNFFSSYNIINLFKQSAIVGIITIGLSFCLVSGKIDLSCGAVCGFSAMLVALLMSKAGWSPLPAILVTVVVSSLWGLLNGYVIFDLGVTPFIATLGAENIIKGVIKYISNSQTISGLPAEFNKFAVKTWFGIPTLVCCWLIIVAIAFFIMKYTKLGRSIYICGSGHEVAKLSGISVRRYTYTAFFMSSLLASIAGVLMTSRLNCAVPTGGTGYETLAIAGGVIGGISMHGATGSPIGAALGTFLIVLIANGGIHLGINPFIMDSLSGIMLIVAVFFNILRERKGKTATK